jgi:NTP pyrophosphatase (non-canonical NTP hydrolase)
MSDQETSLAELRSAVRRFVDARDWNQFHSPKNLSMALAIEAAELMEHFQWITPDASRAVGDDPESLQMVSEELADVFCYVLALANALDLDLSLSLQRKMVKNEQKYPAEEYQGRYGPRDSR